MHKTFASPEYPEDSAFRQRDSYLEVREASGVLVGLVRIGRRTSGPEEVSL